MKDGKTSRLGLERVRFREGFGSELGEESKGGLVFLKGLWWWVECVGGFLKVGWGFLEDREEANLKVPSARLLIDKGGTGAKEEGSVTVVGVSTSILTTELLVDPIGFFAEAEPLGGQVEVEGTSLTGGGFLWDFCGVLLTCFG